MLLRCRRANDPRVTLPPGALWCYAAPPPPHQQGSPRSSRRRIKARARLAPQVIRERLPSSVALPENEHRSGEVRRKHLREYYIHQLLPRSPTLPKEPARWFFRGLISACFLPFPVYEALTCPSSHVSGSREAGRPEAIPPPCSRRPPGKGGLPRGTVRPAPPPRRSPAAAG